MEIIKGKNELPIEVLEPKIIRNSYTEKLENSTIGEKIIVNPTENVFEAFPTTVRKRKKLFCEGFIKYHF
jgi:hypothetical protein